MKKICALPIITIMLMTACQPTPEDLAVKQKDGQVLMKSITEADTGEPENNEPYFAEETWKEHIEGETGKFACIIDADVEVPEIGAFPAIYVEPKQFTVDFIKSVVFYLVPEDISLNLYDSGSGSPTAHYTQEQVESIILSIQETVNNPNSFLNQMKETDPEGYQERLEIEMEALQKYLAMHESGKYPDEMTEESLVITEDLIKKTFSATNIPPMMTDPTVYEGIPRVVLMVADSDADGGIYNKLSLSIKKEQSETNDTITSEQAAEIANAVISELGIEGMNLSAITKPDEQSKYFQIYYSRDYEGIPTTYTSNEISFDSDAGTYSFAWVEEIIEIKLYPDGDFRSFAYTSPLTEGEMLSDNVDVLSFEEIKNTFGNQIVYENIYLEDHVIKRDYHITDIKLGMMRVAVKNETNKYMVIPVWDFFGYYVDTYDSQESTQWALDENNQHAFNDDDTFYSVLTINAIDGTIIDRTLGY